jgi:amidase
MNLSDYTKHDAVALAELVRRKSVSAAELIDAANSAMDAVNDALNAVIGRPAKWAAAWRRALSRSRTRPWRRACAPAV